MTSTTRDRRPPDDIRLELFVPFFVPENPFVASSTSTSSSKNSSSSSTFHLSQECVRRFRSWKTKYFQLIRAIEWCLPDQEALEKTIQRVKKYNTERYQTYFELDASDPEKSKELLGEWNEEIMNKLLLPSSQQDDKNTVKNNNSSSASKGLALLCVFGTAADSPVQQQQEKNVGPNQPPNIADLYEKKKKIRVEDIKVDKNTKSFTKSVQTTSRSLR